MSNPYKGLPNSSFWRRAVPCVERHEFDPVISVKFKIKPFERVVTAGSCFAQHISRKLASVGFNYFVTESGEGLPAEVRKATNYGVFSARYGRSEAHTSDLQSLMRTSYAVSVLRKKK